MARFNPDDPDSWVPRKEPAPRRPTIADVVASWSTRTDVTQDVTSGDPAKQGGDRLAAQQTAKPLAGAPAIACVLLLSWLIPVAVWAIVVVGVTCSVIFLLVAYSYRRDGMRLFAKPAVVAALVMYAIALFTVAYAVCALSQPGSVQTNGSSPPGSLGVVALLATGLGIAGGEVGTHVQEAARLVAHLQLLLVVGAVAGIGAQVVQRLTGGEATAVIAPSGSPSLELYSRVYARLSERRGDVALDELGMKDPATRQDLRQRIQDLPSPEIVTEPEATRVFTRIDSGDLEFFFPLTFEGTSLGDTVRAWLHRGSRSP